jgi:hypothetical protein
MYRRKHRDQGASLDLQFTFRRTRLLPSLAIVCCLLLGSSAQAFSSFDSKPFASPNPDLSLARRSSASFSQWSPAKLRSAASSRKTGSKLLAPRGTESVSLRSLHFLSTAHPFRNLANDASLGFGRSPPSL